MRGIFWLAENRLASQEGLPHPFYIHGQCTDQFARICRETECVHPSVVLKEATVVFWRNKNQVTACAFVSVYFVRHIEPVWPTKETCSVILRIKILCYEKGILLTRATFRMDLYRPKMPGFGVNRPTPINWPFLLRHVPKIGQKALLASSCLSARQHGTTPLPSDGLSWNLTFEYFSKLCQ